MLTPAQLHPGALVYICRSSPRAGHPPEVQFAAAEVLELVADSTHTYALLKPLRVYCMVQGFPEHGTHLPAMSGPYCALVGELRPLFE